MAAEIKRLGDAELEEDTTVCGEKLNFFQAYPEFAAFRAQVRETLGLDADDRDAA